MVSPPQVAHARARRTSRRLSIVALAFLVGLVFGVPASQAAGTTESSVEAAIVSLLNKDRVARGLPKLGVTSGLASIAGTRAKTLATKQVLSHTAAGNLQSQLNAAGIVWRAWGENIARTSTPWGSNTAPQLYALWKGSPSHWSLMMSRDMNRIGVGVSRSSNGSTYASIVFIKSPGGTTAPPPAPKPAPKATPKPAPKAIPKPVVVAPTPEPTPEPQLWIADPSGGRPDGEVAEWSPWSLVEWFADSVDSVARAVVQVFSWIASLGGRLASLR